MSGYMDVWCCVDVDARKAGEAAEWLTQGIFDDPRLAVPADTSSFHSTSTQPTFSELRFVAMLS